MEAAKWVRKAAEQNDAMAQDNLGVFYRDGVGVPKDELTAVGWFRKAAERAYPEAQYNLGVCYRDGQGVPASVAEAVKWFRAAAEQNYAPAQNNLGSCYLQGIGVPKDAKEAVRWWRKAAEQNQVAAQNSLGGGYALGQGVEKDEVKAVEWYRKAAEQNFAGAQFNLGYCYAMGQGVPQDYVEGYKWLLLSAGQGLQPAKETMTRLERRLTPTQLAEGQKRASSFVPPEALSINAQPAGAGGNEPAELLPKAESGDAKAQNELGEAFYAGKRIVAKDPVKAVEWFRKAAEQNLAAAQSNLGVCYERGDGVAKYEVEAYKWDLLAAAQGDTKAKRDVSMLELMMSREQLAEGKRRAEAWLSERQTK